MADECVADECATDVDAIPTIASDEDTAPIVTVTSFVCVAGNDLGRAFRVGHTPLVIERGSE